MPSPTRATSPRTSLPSASKQSPLSVFFFLSLNLYLTTLAKQFAWGPLSLLTVLCIGTNHPSRHLFQTIVCVAHLYGVALYYATNWAEHRVHDVSYSRPEVLYFWVYYVGFNAPWAIVPLGESSCISSNPLANRRACDTDN